MSQIFYDSLIVLDDVEVRIKRIAQTPEERHELWMIVDEIVHHHVMGCILDKLPEKHHDEFLGRFHAKPHDHSLLGYLKEKVEGIEEAISNEVKLLQSTLLD